MSQDKNASQIFEDALTDRIKTMMGDMIPEEVVREKITKIFDEAFFTREQGHNAGPRRPTALTQMIIDRIIQEQTKAVIEPYLALISPMIQEMINERIQTGFLKSIIEDIDNRIKGSVYSPINELKTQLRNLGIGINIY